MKQYEPNLYLQSLNFYKFNQLDDLNFSLCFICFGGYCGSGDTINHRWPSQCIHAINTHNALHNVLAHIKEHVQYSSVSDWYKVSTEQPLALCNAQWCQPTLPLPTHSANWFCVRGHFDGEARAGRCWLGWHTWSWALPVTTQTWHKHLQSYILP